MTDAGPAKMARRPEAAASTVETKRRKADERLEKEAAARRALFVAALAGFVTAFALIAGSGTPDPAGGETEPGLEGAAAPGTRVIAEVPIANINGDGAETIIRIVAPDQGAAVPHLRTRAS